MFSVFTNDFEPFYIFSKVAFSMHFEFIHQVEFLNPIAENYLINYVKHLPENKSSIIKKSLNYKKEKTLYYTSIRDLKNEVYDNLNSEYVFSGYYVKTKYSNYEYKRTGRVFIQDHFIYNKLGIYDFNDEIIELKEVLLKNDIDNLKFIVENFDNNYYLVYQKYSDFNFDSLYES